MKKEHRIILDLLESYLEKIQVKDLGRHFLILVLMNFRKLLIQEIQIIT